MQTTDNPNTENAEPKNPEALYYQKFAESDDDIPMNDLRIIAQRKLAYSGIALAILFFIAFFTFKIPIEQNFNFVLKGQQQEKIYRFANIIHINEVFVKAGKKVKKGDNLVRITSPEIVQMISQYQTSQRNLDLFYAHDTLIYNSEKISLELQIDELGLLIEQLLTETTHKNDIFKAEKEQLHFKVTEAQRRFEINEQLFKTKAIAEYELKDSESEKIALTTKLKQLVNTYQQDIKNLQSSVDRNAISRKLLIEQLSKIELEKAKKESDLLHQFQIAHENLYLNFGTVGIKGQNLILKAERNGEIAYIFDGTKELPTNQVLLKIMEADSPLYAYTEVSPDKVGFIKDKQKVVLKISTFPHYRWGVLQGDVKHLSKTPATNNQYPFETSLTNLGKMKGLLQVGMTGEMAILTEERTMAELIFDKVYEKIEPIVGF
jgi:multidrug efflux pump subunit AcrA (membrane-fusion protein)